LDERTGTTPDRSYARRPEMTESALTPRLTEDPPDEGSGGTSGGGKTGRTRTVVVDDLVPQADPEEEGGGSPGGGHDKQPGDRERRLDPEGVADPDQD
jgi:hypothetical protein